MDLLAFKVVIEPDEDVWQSYYTAWEHLGAATCGETQEEAAVNIKEVLEMIVGEIEEGMIEWPIEPWAPDWEFSKPSIQDEPDLVQIKCAPEHPDAIASHGGLSIKDLQPGIVHDSVYRLIYVAIDDVLASIYERDTLSETRTGGYVSTVFALPVRYNPESQYGYVSRGAQIRLERARQRQSPPVRE
ncbi:MAG: hypothetical protein OXL37_06975 [Chloroflexota bacterium]|nr:hypothetical protein [Chloroflexota bacterium]MDE2960639.1 hypothetical protein [Chloroflexota bacterium]